VKFEKLPKGVRLAVEAAQEKKAGAITVLDLSGLSAFTEYFVICTGYSTPQLQAICSEVEDVLYKEMKRSPEHREGRRSAEWALLDFVEAGAVAGGAGRAGSAQAERAFGKSGIGGVSQIWGFLRGAPTTTLSF
jgi:ribosome silencing factor RsfS/YbeB/iojap